MNIICRYSGSVYAVLFPFLQSSRKIQHRLKQLTLSPEELLAMNKEVIHMLPAVPGSQEHYMCTVCRSILSDAVRYQTLPPSLSSYNLLAIVRLIP